jgi:hypothetical protein
MLFEGVNWGNDVSKIQYGSCVTVENPETIFLSLKPSSEVTGLAYVLLHIA